MRKTRVIEEVTDDLTGEVLMEGEGETIVFGWKGQWLEIDLTRSIALTFRELVEPYAQAARPHEPGQQIDVPAAPSERSRSGRNHAQEQQARKRNQQIRAWAAWNGFTLSERGRIGEDVIAAFERAVEENSGEIPQPQRRQPSFAGDDPGEWHGSQSVDQERVERVE